MGYELSGKLRCGGSGADFETLEELKKRYEEFKIKDQRDPDYNEFINRFEKRIKFCELALDGITARELELIFYLNFCRKETFHRVLRIATREACAFSQLCQFYEDSETFVKKIEEEMPPLDEYLDFTDDLFLSVLEERISSARFNLNKKK